MTPLPRRGSSRRRASASAAAMPRPRRDTTARGPRAAADATSEPDPGPAPEIVFDRVTGPYLRRFAAALPGARACDEDA